jgi:hypothetical protein
MKITLYKSAICPRCILAQMTLNSIAKTRTDLEIETVDVLTNFKRYQEDQIGMFPAIKYQDKILQGVLLTPSSIKNFILDL